MKRTNLYLVLLSAALLIIAAGCTSDAPNTGGIEATLTLDAGATTKHFTDVGVLIQCDGIDPITGLPWPAELFAVNVSTSEGNNPLDPKDSLGVFKKEGLPEGNCTVTIGAVSDDGTMTCAGQMPNIPVVAGPDNTFVTIVVNCITDARYGGIGVEGEFNQCMEYSQIIVSPTTQSVGNDIDIDIWCYDPDGDDGQYLVLFMTAASVAANPTDASMWQPCGTTNEGAKPCPHSEPPTVPANQSASDTVTCNLSNEACLVMVSVSDDYFAHLYTDPYGCHGLYDSAFASIPVYCQGFSVCGDSTVEPPEECDPPGSPNGNNEYCDASCKIFDPCADPLNPPASCPDVTDAECQSVTCSENSGVISCGIANASNGTTCSIGSCNNGACVACVTDADCNDGSDCTTDSCTPGGCVNTPAAAGTPCGTDGQCASDGSCAEGACTNANDSTFQCNNDVQGNLTVCGICDSFGAGCPTVDCNGNPVTIIGGAGDGVAAAQCADALQGPSCTPGMSAACNGCYLDTVSCATANCAGVCAADAASCACLDCNYGNCNTDFNTCAGFDSPSSSTIGGPPECEAVGACNP